MKKHRFGIVLAAFVLSAAAHAQKGTLQFGEPNTNPPPPPPPVYQTAPATASAPQPQPPPSQTYVYDQKPIANRPVLVTQEQAQNIINGFKAAYPKLGSPRFLIYVNRELVDQQSGMKLIHRSETIEGARGDSANPAIKGTEKNEYRADDKPQSTLADKQTVRDVERLFGRPLRDAGASLVDQKVASQLIADKPIADFVGSTDTPQARKDREALGKIADVVIEVLVSSKSVSVPTISGSQNVTIPDIQATAIRLSDSKILGQASSSDVTSRVPPANVGDFDVHSVSDATALELMEDMTPRQ